MDPIHFARGGSQDQWSTPLFGICALVFIFLKIFTPPVEKTLICIVAPSFFLLQTINFFGHGLTRHLIPEEFFGSWLLNQTNIHKYRDNAAQAWANV